MVIDDQREVLAFLANPHLYGGPDTAVARIDTHSAAVFVGGARALKLKRAVRYDYLDFSTLERRRRFAEAEVTLNRRSAPTIYRGVVPVTREVDGRLALGGAGPAVEWVVDMTRFDESTLFDRLAGDGRLPLALMAPLAAEVARLHARAARRRAGACAGMAWVVEGNRLGLEEFGDRIVSRDDRTRLAERTVEALAAATGLLEQRQRLGFVRQCHGDLHLRNIVLLDGRPTLFDAVEFNDDIACIDVAYDLAFLLMDLWRRALLAHANVVLNEYLRHTGDFGCLSLLPLFLSCRAAIRAKTSATAASLASDPAAASALESLGQRYAREALAFLAPAPPRLVAIGGLSGSGKSTVAATLAPALGSPPGALHLRSDVIRKGLLGATPSTRLPHDAYSTEVTARVYATIREQAAVALASGHTVIADAVFSQPDARRAIAAVAEAAGVPFRGVWLDAPAPLLAARVRERRGDASDATEEVVRRQLAAEHGTITWPRVDATAEIGHVRDQVARVIGPLDRPVADHAS